MRVRTDWEDLPDLVRMTVRIRAGQVVSAKTVPGGAACDAAMVLDTEQGGPLFVKGVRTQDRDGRRAQVREGRINPFLSSVSPAVRWEAEVSGWHVIAFAFVAGAPADLGSASADLEPVAEVLRLARLCRVPPGVDLPPLTERYLPCLRPGDADALAGADLLHTDPNPRNLLVTEQRAYLVDWTAPALGPSWVDPALSAVRLMESGCEPSEARAWLAGFPDWTRAPKDAAERFVELMCRHRTHTVGAEAEPGNARLRALLG
jgi:hypothetical protein